MIAEPILTLAWLTLAHLVADFILQTADIVADKTATGSRAMQGMLAHGIGVAVCLIPVAVAFGVPGLLALVAITAAHVVIDRTKVVLTRRAESVALGDARRRHEGRAPAAGLGRAWTALPASYFLLDQTAHLAVTAIAWAIWLAGQAPTVEWSSAVNGLLGGRDLGAVHDLVLGAVVIVALVIANIRGGALFVAILVRPFEAASEAGLDVGGESAAGTAADAATPDAPAPASDARASARPRGWSFRLGPIAGRLQPDPVPTPRVDEPDDPAERSVLPPPAKVGATIGVLERLLIVTFLLSGADAAIGFVIAAKTIARFQLLDDREFAEYYLLGTLASVSVAIVTGLAARAALA